jgi:hypothetical protein
MTQAQRKVSRNHALCQVYNPALSPFKMNTYVSVDSKRVIRTFFCGFGWRDSDGLARQGHRPGMCRYLIRSVAVSTGAGLESRDLVSVYTLKV